MAIPLFLATTGHEISKIRELPPNIAWMACHFSPYGTGLTNLPPALPPGSMVIVNDRIPVCGHDPVLITRQLSDLVDASGCHSILLDFQRPDEPQTAAIVEALVHALPCPVGASAPYAQGLDCPVFLPPVPAHILLNDYLRPWQNRPVWLEAALNAVTVTVSAEGTTVSTSVPDFSKQIHHDRDLHCHYSITTLQEQIQFHLFRTPEDLLSLLSVAEHLSVTQAIGLYQELM